MYPCYRTYGICGHVTYLYTLVVSGFTCFVHTAIPLETREFTADQTYRRVVRSGATLDALPLPIVLN